MKKKAPPIPARKLGAAGRSRPETLEITIPEAMLPFVSFAKLRRGRENINPIAPGEWPDNPHPGDPMNVEEIERRHDLRNLYE